MDMADLMTLTALQASSEADAHWHGVAARAELPEDADWRRKKRAYRRGVLAYKREWSATEGWRSSRPS